MYISTKDWKNYIDKMSKLNKAAADKIIAYVQKNGFGNTDELIKYANAVVMTYGSGSAALAAAMYDATAEAAGAFYDPAEPAPLPKYGEVAKTVMGTLKRSQNVNELAGAVSRLVKRTGADTTLQNAYRDRKKYGKKRNTGAQVAWVPMGDTCPFCLMLASNGWRNQTVGGQQHAEHIHANCDCNYAVRFNDSSGVAGYDPDRYKEMFDELDGDSWNEKVNAMRRKQYEQDKDRINAQKRAAYAERTKVQEQEKKSRINEYSVDRNLVGTKEYKDKFLSLSFDPDVNQKLYDKAIDMLDHRSGTDYEDMNLISSVDGLVKGTQTKVEYYEKVPEELRHNHVWYNESLESAIKNNSSNTLIAIHNHPGSFPPSGADFQSQFDHGYKAGVIACHNGDVYYYTVGKKKFTGKLFDMTVDKYVKQGYSDLEAYKMCLDQFVKDYGITWRKL